MQTSGTKYGYSVYAVETGNLVAVSSITHATPEQAESDAREHHLSIYRPNTARVDIHEIRTGVAGQPFGEEYGQIVKSIGN